MTIRGFASLDELVAVQNRLAEMYGWSAPHAKQHLDEYISQFGSNPEWLFVAEEAGTVQGALLASDRGRDGSLLISSFGVFPEYQRKGVGTALLAKTERRARQRGKVRLLCGRRRRYGAVLSEVRLHTTALYRDHWRRKRRHVGILARRSPGSVQRPVVRHRVSSSAR